MNDVTLMGNIGQDPELRTLESGAQVCNASLATTRTYKDKQGNKQTQTQWHSLVIWGAKAVAFAEYVQKGQQMLINGEIAYDNFKDKDGVSHKTTKIVVRSFEFGKSPVGESRKTQPTPQPATANAGEDDLPF